MSGNHLKPSQANTRKGKNSYLLELNDGFVVRVRKLDTVQMIFEGQLTLPMLRAAQKFEDIQGKFSSATPDEQDKLVNEFLAAEGKKEFVDMLRDYACRHVIEPKIVPEEDGNPEHLCVDDLEFSELLLIFNSSPTKNQELSALAEEFRGTESAAHGTPVSDGEDVRPAPELVVVPTERETVGR